ACLRQFQSWNAAESRSEPAEPFAGGSAMERSGNGGNCRSQACPGGGSLRLCQRRHSLACALSRSSKGRSLPPQSEWGAGSRCSDVWPAGSSREPWLGGEGASLKAHGGTRTAKGQTNMGTGQVAQVARWRATLKASGCWCLLDGRGMEERLN